jgi:hypothetical protein
VKATAAPKAKAKVSPPKPSQLTPTTRSPATNVAAAPTETTSSKPAEIKDEVTNQHPPANLSYSKEDVGRTIEMYVFRYNTWEPLELLDFEPTKKLHKCRHLDKSEKWLDLKKKPIRSQKENK